MQSFLSKKFMREEELNQKIELLHRSFDLEPDLLKSVSSLNKKLEPLSLRIQKARSEDSGQLYYGLVNLREDEAAKLGAEYGLVERQFFKDCLQAILDCETGEVSSLELLGMNMTSGGSRKKVTEKERLLEKFTKDGWLSSALGKLYPGPRTVLELYPHFSETHSDRVFKCLQCKEVVVRREICENCEANFHLYCMERLRTASEPACPNCSDTPSLAPPYTLHFQI
ncbi:Non-structural maintenance of chromosomes element 1-like protein isoform X4 [Oopsacas minuta]|uniref:Non-structural maintenance of chromosomes element 1 homolog n=1 Tax=Oopsacas minuta TaxID=111878 RepID=A0AAV7JXZ9_9METZ|nr:Non-structural maintenance of chromosomes element 1-like protein isoform X4 [Oopsacas minuta]